MLAVCGGGRMGLYQCPTECSDDTPQEQCVCSCPDLEAKVESGEWRSLLELAFDIPAYLAEVQAKDDDTQARTRGRTAY